MRRVGFVGFRGMVGSVLVERMKAEGDWRGFDPTFFSTTQSGASPPDVGLAAPPVGDANDVTSLRTMHVIVSCQGDEYTTAIHPRLRADGWKGIWIDAASALRMSNDAVIVLDPVNARVIERGRARGVVDFIGGNCTVSLMIMAMAGPIAQGWVEWISSMTYQAASGAGAKNMEELVHQMRAIGDATRGPASSILDLDRQVSASLTSAAFPTACFGVPLAASVIPWIGSAVANGQTREEWKGQAEANKILDQHPPIPIDGLCVRVGAMRCHSQALTVKLRNAVPLDAIEACIRESHPWARVIPNTPDATKKQLTPAAVSGTLDIAVGRLRTMNMGPEYLAAFTVGDQLLWGAAEPLRRVLRMVLD